MANNDNIIYARFNHGHEITTDPRSQYAYGQVVKISGLHLPASFDADIANKGDKQAKVVIGTNNELPIDDNYFLSGKDIIVMINVHATDKDGRTKYIINIPINKRSKRADIELEPVEQDVVSTAIAALNEAVERTSADVESAENSASRAHESAVSAEQSATNASNSEELAQQYMERAETAAESSEKSETKAKASEESAKQSETHAEQIANDIEQYTERAETASRNAEASANTATEKAGEISESAYIAATKADEASNAATHAQQAATYAGEFANSASASANNAELNAQKTQSDREVVESAKSDVLSAVDNAQNYANSAQLASQAIQNMDVEATTLEPDSDATVEKTVDAISGAVTLTYGIPKGQVGEKGDKGDTGDSGVYIGTSAPSDENVNVWIDSNGEPDDVIQIDDTLTQSGQAADAKVVGDELFSDTSTETPITLTTTVGNWRLKTDGYAEQNASYNLKKYQVTAGDTIKVVSDDYFQFQTSASVPTSGTQSIVGETYTTGTFTLEVPATATYLIVSTPKTNSQAAVYNVVEGERFSKIGALTDRLNAIDTASAADVGKALKVKTVSDGKVTEWEFGATGDTEEIDSLNEQMAMLITKSEKPQPEPTSIVQCVDLSQASLDSGGKHYNNVKIEVPWVGRYDMNPSNLNLRFYYMKPYDANGNVLQFYRNGIAWTNLNCPKGGYFVKVDERTIKTYASSGALDWTWTADGDIAYLYNTAAYTGCVDGFTDPTQLVGVTFGGASETYIPYVDSETPDTPTEYDYKYSGELMSAVHDGLVENYTDEEPTQDSTNFVKSGGVVSYLLKETYNLVDPSWFDWSQEATASYIDLKAGLFIPAEAGRVILSNAEKVSYKFYDATKTEIGRKGSAIAYAPVTIPGGTSYMRISLNNAAGYIPSDHKVVIYYSEITASPRDDIRGYIDHFNLQGMRGSDEVFDYYAPTALDKNILQMAKYSAVRNMNFCNNIVRIGTCNMYLPRTTRGWQTFKKMYADFAVDIVGFQEVSNNNDRILTEFLKGWQFTNGYTDAPVAVASHFPIISHDIYTTTVTSRKWTRAVIQLPRYADVINPTLSIYDYHGVWDGGTPEKRAQEVAEILAVIAQDTSDFKIVVGDTNVQSPSEWDTWRNAGFTPVNDGNGTITTIDEYSLDNIFYGSGITCKNWHVVPAEDYLINISGNDVPVSDHDFVFADLVFDFDALL